MSHPPLPDVAAQHLNSTTPLDWVGMCGIAMPMQIGGRLVAATADAGVNLVDGNSRGIHMSRLYLALENLEQEPLRPLLLRRLLASFLNSHDGQSSAAYVRLSYQHLLKRPALVSPLAGWKSYDVEIHARIEHEMFHVELSVSIPYSSTCPCSAALARQLIQRQFQARFGIGNVDSDEVVAWLGTSEGIVATPHSQRSMAKISVRLEDNHPDLPITEVIDKAEQALGTAVQTAVKRADEQAFALANGQNLMFCEDAARRVYGALRAVEWSKAFKVRVEHAESLHAHDAVATAQWQWNITSEA
ncbi:MULTISPECIES: GTP cyclohydrolase FolE2 [Pseudomonas]|uniref:GTP cyclohydrolase FolE2 n=1 Tax=Pseudomonas parafulva TaxID=157782 RepID=A0AAJ0LJJ0_9PSED|nr:MULTISPECIES: GTP cyclohydrolase FolE2 [Pseudomonas]AQW70610.1 GTP cyclohydrolase [Pseudomonas parafulva]KTT17461.1 GTP cyclohydrolase [Pseudomonas parafulva]MBF8635171.1 GTP cyclohydrolase I FolE2 [Pseudomonas fulva]MBF8687389.1 GTP cyclohydrolase I FolE2 [Pseudomonas fulva]MEB8056116.1 GTP cyclohydrolase FolE2 [Pseudomonas fulva]